MISKFNISHLRNAEYLTFMQAAARLAQKHTSLFCRWHRGQKKVRA
jgi:hypothetical protein